MISQFNLYKNFVDNNNTFKELISGIFMVKKSLVLFSGGKDSMYALQWALKKGHSCILVSIKNKDGSAHFHAGPEIDDILRKTQLDLIGLPFREILTREKNYMQDTFLGLKKIVSKENISQMILGDLWLP